MESRQLGIRSGLGLDFVVSNFEHYQDQCVSPAMVLTGGYPVLYCLLAFVLTIYVIAQVVKDNSIMDIAWGMGFIFIAGTTFYFSEAGMKAYVLMAAVLLWGLRLSLFLAFRNIGKGEDYRYAAWRKDWGENAWWRAFFQVFLLQGFIMYLVSLVVIQGISEMPQELNALNYVGILVFAIGLLFEAVGDDQMRRFKADSSNEGKVMNSGLWRYTRHPNYFGEALLWWGIFLISIPSGSLLLSLLSPCLMTFLLLKVSGVAMLERKYSNNPAYRAYQESTSAFIPWKPSR